MHLFIFCIFGQIDLAPIMNNQNYIKVLGKSVFDGMHGYLFMHLLSNALVDATTFL